MSSRQIQLAYAYGPPEVKGEIRRSPEDFIVEEQLGFEPDGCGEHVFLKIKKRNTNTDQVARQLARLAGVKNHDVGYAGLKDRNAVTIQWLSVYLAAKPEPEWKALETEDLQIMEIARHQKKLRRGVLKANRFTIKVRDLHGDISSIDTRLTKIKQHGVPNYFGEQRFGRNNIGEAMAMFEGRRLVRDRHKRGLYLSAVRSLLFNAILSRRVADGTWNRALSGDAFILDGSHSFFTASVIDEEIEKRVTEHDIHPSGPLWGDGEPSTLADVRVIEEQVLHDYQLECSGLESAGLRQQRRALRVIPQKFSWHYKDDKSLLMRFELMAGSYATVFIREIV